MISSTLLFKATENYPRNSEGTMIKTSSGKLIFAWSRFENKKVMPDGIQPGATSHTAEFCDILESDNDKAAIMAVTSEDDGKNWQGERTIVHSDYSMNVMSPAFAILQDGSLGMVYSDRKSKENANRLFIRSFNEGKSWTDPVQITYEGYKTGCHDRFTVLSNGRLLVPLHCTDDWYNHYLHVRVAWSDDIGTTWKIGDPIILPRVDGFFESGAMEPTLIKLNSGALLMVIRTAMGTLFRADSFDSGKSWTNIRSMGVISPIAPAVLRRLDESVLIMLWNRNFDITHPMGGARTPLVLGISRDEGRTWPVSEHFILEDDGEHAFSYPSCLVTEKEILITYSVSKLNDQFGKRSLKLMRIQKRELSAV